MLGKWLFQIAKSPLTGTLVGKAFQYCSWMIPVEKVLGSPQVFAFRHPQPSYENHIILTPKKAIRSLLQLADEPGYLAGIWQAVQSLRAAHPAFAGSFVLIANGGKKQEVQQVHFHLFTNHRLVDAYHAKVCAENTILRTETLTVFGHPHPEWEHHFVCMPVGDGWFQSVLKSIQALDDHFHIVSKGYSLLFQHDSRQAIPEPPVFHIISGQKRA